MCLLVKDNIKKSQEEVCKRKVERGQEANFQVGDLVLQKKQTSDKNREKGGRMETEMLGPLKIISHDG